VLVIHGLTRGSPTLHILVFVNRDFSMRRRLVTPRELHLRKLITARVNAIGLTAASFTHLKGIFECYAKLIILPLKMLGYG
jgi:hypothetical protein